ncbi:MAG: AAA family ATPase [Anaerolineae bacterium]|nr:AAA family ATPase [Anaerolineae bacterium]
MIRSYSNVLRRWLWLLALTTALAGAGSYALSSREPVHYTARAKLLVGPAVDSLSPEVNDLRAAAQLMEIYAVLPTMRPFLETIIADLGLDTSPGMLEGDITLTTDTTTQILTVRVDQDDRDQATLIANAIAEQLVAQSPASGAQNVTAWEQLQGQIARVEGTIASSEETLQRLDGELSRAATDEQRALISEQIRQERTYKSEAEKLLISLYSALQSTPNNRITIVEPAVRGRPIDRQVPLKTALGLLAGLIAGGALVLGAEYANDTIRSADDLRGVAGASYLGDVVTRPTPGRAAPVVLTHATSPTAESYRRLAMKLRLAGRALALNRLLVSDLHGEGSGGEVAANLAVVLAQLGDNVLLLDTDIQDRTASRIFGVANKPGLAEWHDSQSAIADLLLPTEVEGLAILPSGTHALDFFALVASPRFANALASLDELADIVVIAAPPLGAVVAATVLAARADRTVVVARSGHSHRRHVREAIDSLGEVEAQIAGVVLAKRARSLRRWPLVRRAHASVQSARVQATPAKRHPSSKTAES